MILSKWIKKDNDEFNVYQDILLDENDIKTIRKIPWDIFNKLLDITKAELWKKSLEGKITREEAQWAISFAKYLKNYFNI